MTLPIRTRFAPSPTGYLHIGGVRTALFNWLFARHHGGQFILRIDDTDQQRNVDESLAPILHGFRWLGLDWDEGPEVGGPHGPYYQSQRAGKYQAAACVLLERGAAYRDYATTEEVQAEREAAEKEKRSFVYSRRWMAESDADRQRFEAEGRTAVVRLKMPRQGTLELDDLVRGRVGFDWAREQDHVIQRADGSCLYHLATVVDDHDMQISHIIRAEEHLSNTPRQVFIYESLGYDLPQFAHLPYVAEPGSKTKISKRKLDKYLRDKDFKRLYDHAINVATTFNVHLLAFVNDNELGEITDANRQQIMLKLRNDFQAMIQRSHDQPVPLEFESEILSHTEEIFRDPALMDAYQRGHDIIQRSVIDKTPDTFNPVLTDFYEQVGYLPDALLNYLLLLGWSLDDKTEEFTRDEMIEHFSLERVNKAPASFDPQKLMAFQNRAMQQVPIKQRVALVLPFLQRAGLIADPPPCDVAPRLTRIVSVAGDRIKIAGDILDYDYFFITDDRLSYDKKAFEKRIRRPAEAAELLTKFRARLSATESFDAPTLDKLLHTFVEAEEVKIGQIIHALRVAVSGKAVGFGVFDTLAITGRESCLARIDRAVEKNNDEQRGEPEA